MSSMTSRPHVVDAPIKDIKVFANVVALAHRYSEGDVVVPARLEPVARDDEGVLYRFSARVLVPRHGHAGRELSYTDEFREPHGDNLPNISDNLDVLGREISAEIGSKYDLRRETRLDNSGYLVISHRTNKI